MTDEGTHEPEGDASAVAARRTRATAALEGDPQPVGRALLSRSAESRDWADTGDPDYEPALEGASAEDVEGDPRSEQTAGGDGPATGGPAPDLSAVAARRVGGAVRVRAPAHPAGAAGPADGATSRAGTLAGRGGQEGSGGLGGTGVAGGEAPGAGGEASGGEATGGGGEAPSRAATPGGGGGEGGQRQPSELAPWAAVPEADTVMLALPTFPTETPADAQPDAEPDAPDGDRPSTEEQARERASARQRLAEQVAESARMASLSVEQAAALIEAQTAELTSSASDAAGGSTAAAPPQKKAARKPRPAPRQPMLLQGLGPAVLAGALILASSFGVLPLAVAVLGVQVFLVLGALALLDAPAAGGAFLVATGAVVAADAVVLLDDGSISRIAGVVGLGFVAALGHQLARRGRSRVTESLADTLVVLVVAVATACLIALHEVEGGREVLHVSLAAAGAVLLAGRIGDRFAPGPVLAVGATRGWPGLLLGLLAGVSAAAVVASVAGEPPLGSAVLLGLVVASSVATADLAVDLGAAELRSGWRDARRVAALRPTALLLPYAVLGPIALLAGRLLLT